MERQVGRKQASRKISVNQGQAGTRNPWTPFFFHFTAYTPAAQVRKRSFRKSQITFIYARTSNLSTTLLDSPPFTFQLRKQYPVIRSCQTRYHGLSLLLVLLPPSLAQYTSSSSLSARPSMHLSSMHSCPITSDFGRSGCGVRY